MGLPYIGICYVKKQEEPIKASACVGYELFWRL